MRKRNLGWIFGASLLLAAASTAQQTNATQSPQLTTSQRNQISRTFGKLPLTFEANQGQTDWQTRFVARGNGYSALLTAGGMVLSLRPAKVADAPQTSEAHSSNVPSQSLKTTLQFNLLGATLNPAVVGEDQQPGKVNYFIGNDPRQWHTNVPTYARVRYKNIYPGIDLVYYGNPRQLEYDFEVSASGNPNVIQFEIKGANRIQLDPNGNLVLTIKGGEIKFQSPVVYQISKGQRLAVDGGYVMQDSTHVGFRVAQYDPSKPLVIDPTLVYSTYLGASDVTEPHAIAIDSSGSIYVAGDTDSPDLPGPTLGSYNGISPDAFVAKLDPTGSTLVYADYIGGSQEQEAYALAVDSANELYVTGNTNSNDFPLVNPFQATMAGGFTVFVTKISTDGSSLLYSTYLGGNGSFDQPWGIALDSASDIFVAGETMATNFPTVNAFQSTVSSNQGGVYGEYGFVTEFAPDGSSLVYSTYIGGSSNEMQICSGAPCWEPPDSGIGALAVDANGNAYFGGGTNTHDFPVSAGAYQTTLDPKQVIGGGFVGKFTALGGLVYSTYLSGNGGGPSGVTAIAVDGSGSAYVAGEAISDGTFPITSTSICDPGVFGLACGYSFVTKLDPTGASLLYSTFLGPNNSSVPQGIALDGSNNAYILGYSFGNCGGSFVMVEGIQSCEGMYSLLLVEIDPTASTELFATYLGGSEEGQYPAGIALDSAANIYVGGETLADDFPTTEGAYQSTLNGTSNAFLLKIAPDPGPAFSASPFLLLYTSQQVGSTSGATTALLRNMGNIRLLISSIKVSGDFAETNNCGDAVPAAGTCTFSVTFAPTAAGPRSGSIVIYDNAAGSPHIISLIGNSSGGLIALTPTALAFASQAFGTPSAVQTVTLGNNGNTALKVDSIQVSGDFAQTNNCPAALPAASNCAVQVVFTPTALGIRSGTLTVTDNVQAPQTLNLSGTGSDFDLASSTYRETIKGGEAATYHLTVVPAGGSFVNPVKLSCSGLPMQASCSLSPSSVVPGATGATAIMTITTAASVAASQPPRLFANGPLYAIWVPLQGMGLIGITLAGRRGAAKKWRLSALMGLVILILIVMTACAGGTGVVPQPQSGTPAGTYKITVVGSSGALQHSASVTLIVQ